MAKKKKRGRWDNLKKKKNLKLRQDYMDVHFINGVASITGEGQGLRPLTEEEKDWYNSFYGEYYNASVNHDSYNDQMHDNKDLVKDCYDRNNSRNRCLLNKGKALNKIMFRTWGELDQDTISDTEDFAEQFGNKFDDPVEKRKAFKRINKIYPGIFTEEDFMSYDIELIFMKLQNFNSEF